MCLFEKTINELEPEMILNKALKLGATYADLRYQLYTNEEIRVENKTLEEYKSRNFGGIGIRVTVNGAVGFASTSELKKTNIEKTIKTSIKLAKSFKSNKGVFANTKIAKLNEKIPMKTDPFVISPEEKVNLLKDINKAAWVSDEIKNVITLFGAAYDQRYFLSSEGTETKIIVPVIGLGGMAVASADGKMEAIYDAEGKCSGYEFIKNYDWNTFSIDLANQAIRTAKAKGPPPGTYPVVVDPRLVGILIHEAFGHAAEADLVFTGASTLKDRLGEELAFEGLTIIDTGIINDGYPVPFDDEGVPKGKTIIMENGILKSYIHDRNSANVLAVPPTGNSRAQDFESNPIVRMTNTYIDNGDFSFDELLEGIKEGAYIKRKGSTGGQVETGIGTFTFNGGESFMIRNGELAEQVRGVVISGAILETLKTVDGIGKDLEITTSYFGACGKNSQRARVGFGGPHIRVQKMTLGGQ